jgi:long-subunit acyl-CoA synthetase (AMP-forming)
MKLLYDPWTTESDILTPTMKLKRNIAKDRYADDVKKMYEEGTIKLAPSKLEK